VTRDLRPRGARPLDALVVAALDWEAAAVRAGLAAVVAGPTPRTWRGRTAGGRDVLVAQLGVGRLHAAVALAGLPAARVLAVVGCAGGLGPALRAGDLVVATEIVRLANGERHACATAAVERWAAATDLAVLAGAHAAADAVLADAAAKAAAGERAAALVAEMEGWAVVEAARARGVPVVGLRAVLDEADEHVPLLAGAVDETTGDLRVAAAARALAYRPWLWASAVRMARRQRAAERALREASAAGLLDAIVAAGLEAGPGVRTPGPAGGC